MSFNLWILWYCFGSSVVFFSKSALLGYNLYTIKLTYLQFQLLWQMCCVTATTIKIGNISITTKRLPSFRTDESAMPKKRGAGECYKNIALI